MQLLIIYYLLELQGINFLYLIQRWINARHFEDKVIIVSYSNRSQFFVISLQGIKWSLELIDSSIRRKREEK